MAIGRSSRFITSIQCPLSVALQYLSAGQQVPHSSLAEGPCIFHFLNIRAMLILVPSARSGLKKRTSRSCS